ncbi:hypothetical protein BMS3Bbin02_01472 [bacterium BMS3Bbin02]|nr:hypothetical protein BMS3Bbin02_01472 [bacterium BMS3Bbin02]
MRWKRSATVDMNVKIPLTFTPVQEYRLKKRALSDP